MTPERSHWYRAAQGGISGRFGVGVLGAQKIRGNSPDQLPCCRVTYRVTSSELQGNLQGNWAVVTGQGYRVTSLELQGSWVGVHGVVTLERKSFVGKIRGGPGGGFGWWTCDGTEG